MNQSNTELLPSDKDIVVLARSMGLIADNGIDAAEAVEFARAIIRRYEEGRTAPPAPEAAEQPAGEGMTDELDAEIQDILEGVEIGKVLVKHAHAAIMRTIKAASLTSKREQPAFEYICRKCGLRQEPENKDEPQF